MRTWTAKLPSGELTIESDRLANYRRRYVADGDLASRMSELIWFDIYVIDQHFGVNPQEVLQSIYNLEDGEPPSGIKRATVFKHPPLKGLWHKHYFSAHFLVDNIILGLGKNGLGKIVEEVMNPRKSNVITAEMIEELAQRVTHEPVENRNSQGKLTGEWIIFAKYECKNYYLCLNTHTADDNFISDRILEHCPRDFPDIASWIAQAAASV